MQTFSPRFTQQQMNEIATLFDAAIKATGLPGARMALPLVEILEATEPDPPPANEPD